jgi:hypothetical protein
VPDNDSRPTDDKQSRARSGSEGSAVPREVIMGLDDLERKIGFAGAGVSALLALIFIPRLLKNTYLTVSSTPTKKNVCGAGYHIVGSLCEKRELTHPSAWIIQPLVFLLFAVAIAAFSYYRRRPGLVVATMLIGFASQPLLATTTPTGIVFLAFGSWLLIRAYRLHKYGDATFKGSNIRARERAQERRANRGTRGTRGTRGVKSKASKTSSSAQPSRTPAASKRYTPKKTNRR